MRPLRLLLNADFSGANAFFALAARRGLYEAAGIDLQCTPGRGAYTAAGRLAAEGFDAAYGDLGALIEHAALQPDGDAPVAVMLMHTHAPTCITVARNGPLHAPGDLAGRTVCGHPGDVALRTFPAYARSAGLDPGTVRIVRSDAPMGDLLQDMLAGRSDAVFGYLSTHRAALASCGLDADDAVRFLPYRAYCDVLAGSALMVSPQLLQRSPEAVQALVCVTRRGIRSAAQEPDAAIDAVLQLRPAADRQIEHRRWLDTWQGDMGGARFLAGGLSACGGIAASRLAAMVECLASASGWAHRPPVDALFTDRFVAAPG